MLPSVSKKMQASEVNNTRKLQIGTDIWQTVGFPQLTITLAPDCCPPQVLHCK